jgi:type III secretion protein L
MKNVIKGSKLQLSEGSDRRNLLKRTLIDANDESRQIIENANAYAADLRKQTEIEAEAIKQEAYETGKGAALEEMMGFLMEARDIRNTTLAKTEQELLRLAVKLAERIIGNEVKSDKAVIVDIVSTALRNTKRQEKVTIRVSQSDYATVQERFIELSQSSRSTYVDIVPDPRVTIGGCIIESEVGTVDARLETQLRVLERALIGQTETKDI